MTGLCWSPRYPDLFAASYGSYNFYSSHTEGWLCLFSLKNPSYPEWAIKVPAGVMCLASHPAHPHMLAAGLHDGTVVVYNLHRYHTSLQHCIDLVLKYSDLTPGLPTSPRPVQANTPSPSGRYC